MTDYKILRHQVLQRNPSDRGYCGPIAIAAATGLDAGDVAAYVAPLRVNGRGMRGLDILKAIHDLTGRSPQPYKDTRIKTPITAARNLPKGTYICMTRDHVLCVRDGKVIDWSDERQLRIISIWKVEGV
jgi:hypothetical protein